MVDVASGAKHKLVVQAAITIKLASHLSLFRDSDSLPDPNAAPDGVKDNAQRRRRPPLPLEGATLTCSGVTAVPHPREKGTYQLAIGSLGDGEHVLRITPAAKEDAAPLVPSGAPRVRSQPSPAQLVAPADVKLAYRGVNVLLTLADQKLKTHPRVADPTVRHARVLKGATPTSLEVDIKPDWVRDDDVTARSGALDLVVVHHTGSNSLPGDLATFTSGDKSIHYLMDVDGHIIKMVNDSDNSVHAGRSRWKGQDSVGNRSIGIEIVNGGSTAYSDEQQEAIVELVDQIVAAQSLPRHHVVGHEDIGTGDDTPGASVTPLTKVGRKGGDPGANFPWQRLEQRGLGLQLTGAAPDDATMYNGVFSGGRTVMPRTSGAHVVELRVDLDAIGYSLNNVTSNVYDDHVAAAVFAFQRHFTTLERRNRADDEPRLSFGNVDLRTAREIKQCTRW